MDADPGCTVETIHDAMLQKIRGREIPKDLLRLTSIREERVRVVPNGVSERFLRADAGEDRGAAFPAARSRPAGSPANGPLRILHVGHCAPYKNIETILRAIPAICRRLGVPVLLVKVGGPFTRDQRTLIGQLGLEDRVEYLGTVPLEDLPGVYGRADLLLMPSLHEGFGLPALEAMACGTPVVVSNRGSLPEVVGDAGLLVEPHDIEGIARAAERLTTDPALRTDLIRRGRERARAFTWERTARETLAVYQEVLGQSAPSR